jgi:hemin uptake protein HemP
MRASTDTSLPKTSAQGSSGSSAPAQPVTVKSECLFDNASEVLIDHRGVIYRLRQTSLGKLILTK